MSLLTGLTGLLWVLRAPRDWRNYTALPPLFSAPPEQRGTETTGAVTLSRPHSLICAGGREHCTETRNVAQGLSSRAVPRIPLGGTGRKDMAPQNL